jgi:gliding motility-associated-like protein
VVNQNTTTGGNDFALDDITFSTFCTNTADVTVTVNPQPTANAGPDQSICIGETTQMAGSGGTTYQWVPPIALADPTNPTTDANPIITRTYTLIVQDNIGCEATDQMTLTVNPLPQASAGPDHEVCVGESVVLEGSGGTVYQWSPATDLDNPNAQLPISTPSNSITYTVTVTDNNQCVNTDQTTVTVNPLPIVDAGLDSLICANSTVVLLASGADTYLWSPLVGLSDPQSANPEASPINETTYYVTGTDANGCVSSDSVSITIFSVFAGPDSIVCLNDSVLAFVSDGATFSWTPVEGVSDPTSASPYLNPEVSTLFTVTATSAFGCEASADVNIGILTLPIAGFTAAFEPSCDGIYAGFENNSENSEAYYWSFGDGGMSGEFEPTHTFAPGQGSVITLITYNNDSLCVDTIVVDYSGQWFGNDTIDIKYATAFTPNFDGINDCFKPGFDGRFSECYDLQVFNRWGALIFESTGGQGHCWDGHTKGGKRCDEGTYYYMVSLNGYEKHGYVTLIY